MILEYETVHGYVALKKIRIARNDPRPTPALRKIKTGYRGLHQLFFAHYLHAHRWTKTSRLVTGKRGLFRHFESYERHWPVRCVRLFFDR